VGIIFPQGIDGKGIVVRFETAARLDSFRRGEVQGSGRNAVVEAKFVLSALAETI
jgi:hypothetical protein